MVARGRRAEELDPGDAQRVGSRYRMRWRAPIGYALEFDFTVDEVGQSRGGWPGRATGELEGTGVWRLFEEGGVTAVTYEWNVRAHQALDERARPAAAARCSAGATTGDGGRRRGAGKRWLVA